MNPVEDPSVTRAKGLPVAQQDEKQNLIPQKYRGLPSGMVEEMWQPALAKDTERNKQTAEQRRQALGNLRADELQGAQRRGVELQNLLEHLPTEQKGEIPAVEKQAIQSIADHLSGNSQIPDLTVGEMFLLDKLSESYQKAKEKNPDQPVIFQFSQSVDATIFENLKKKLIFESLQAKGKIQEKEQLADVREKLKVALPATEATEQLEHNPCATFKVKNGETDTGTWWYEYGNEEIRKLEKEGKYKWGNERIYFDIPLKDMEGLRDLAMKVAKDNNIAIAFKYLDTAKTFQRIAESPDTTRFVANFASVADAKKFYESLGQIQGYKALKSDRNLDYHAYNIDGIAHYAQGMRENRMALENVIKTAHPNPDGSYNYTTQDGRQKTIDKGIYENFLRQFESMPDPEKLWKAA
jgi:hypothetical protein